jgi:hypothetical protein
MTKNKKQSRTIIACIKQKNGKIMMAGDRRVSCDWGYSYTCPKPKVRKTDSGLLIGASGDSGLCKLCVDVFEPSEIKTDSQTYMFYTFLPELTKLLKQQPGYVDAHKLLTLSPDEHCCLLVACQGDLYTVDIQGVLVEAGQPTMSRIILDDAPTPYGIGCGADAAIHILNNKKEELGYNTKEHLEIACLNACQTSPGCGLPIDYIKE